MFYVTCYFSVFDDFIIIVVTVKRILSLRDVDDEGI
jgi:hypothetical protein